jgi:hypothetical protein
MDKFSDEELDRILSTRIPGGSAARDWFLPHDTERGLENVREVVQRMFDTGLEILGAGQNEDDDYECPTCGEQDPGTSCGLPNCGLILK